MQREKKFFRKKRRMAASMFSWLLAFAIVVSSVSTAPGFTMTALAAENEAGGGKNGYTVETPDIDGNDAAGGDNGTTPGSSDSSTGEDEASGNEAGSGTDSSTGDDAGSDGSGSAPDSGDGTGSDGSDSTPGSGDGTGSDGSDNTPGSGDGTDPDNSGSTPDDGNGGSGDADDETDPDGSGSEGDDTVTDGEDGTEEDDETLDEEDGIVDEEEPGEEIPDEPVEDETGERVGEVDITLHFYNALNWDAVTIHYWGDGVTGTAWPGKDMTKEGDGWYTVSIKAAAGNDVNYLINNGKNGGNPTAQTADAVILSADFDSGDTYELWTRVEENNVINGKYNVISSTVRGPEVNGSTVIFRYKNDSAASVYLAGTMNDWSGTSDEMQKGSDGVFTYETELAHGEYQYKFVVDGDWRTDPANPLYVQEKDPTTGAVKNTNSLVYVPGDTTYNYTIHYYNPEAPDQDVSTPDLYVWELGIQYAPTSNFYTYESKDTDDNGIAWLTTNFSVPYRSLGIIGRPTKDSWDNQDDNRSYQLAGGTGAELWYIHGKGIYDKKPVFGDVQKVTASMYHPSMDYTQNNVLKLIVNDNEESGADLVAEAYVDASSLGMSDKIAIDPELLEISLSVTEDTVPGSYSLPITVVGNNGSKADTTVTVVVAAKPDGDADFDWDEAVIYFMVTDRFFDGDSGNNAANGSETYGTNAGLYHGGDFAGVTQKLDYLDELGVNTIWITPIVENIKGVTVNGEGKEDVPYNAAYHGYWASDFTKLNPALGTDAEFQALIDAAHARGMKIMVDVVLNHAGYGAEENFPGMLRDTAVDENDAVHGGQQANLPDFLTENEEVRNQLIDWQVAWAEKGVDYFRVDTVKHVDSTTWMAFKNELTKKNPEFKMIGEYFGAGSNWDGDGTLASGQMDSLLDFDFNDWALDFVKGNIASVEQNLATRNARLSNVYLTGQFLSSHDENGFKFSLGDDYSDKDGAAMVAATLQITAKGQPVVYYGEEIGLTGANNYPYQTNRYDFDWNQATDNNKTYVHYKKMLGIREQYSELFAKGDRSVVAGSDADGYDVISRSYNGDTVYVAMNIGSSAKEIEIPVNGNGITAYKDLYDDNNKTYPVSADSKITITVPAAADGGTAVLTAGGFVDTLVAPELTIAKGTDAAGKVSALPYQLTHVAEDGTKTLMDVSYSMDAAEGVTLDGTGCRITVNAAFTGDEITLTATAKEDPDLSAVFTAKVVEDKNEITLRLHYTRTDGAYAGWNVWAWGKGMKDAGHEFDSDGENGEKVATFNLEGRKTDALNYIIRKSIEGNEWADKDIDADRTIDLSDVLSGTVDYYVDSGVFAGRRVLGDDVLLGAKVVSAAYNKKNNTIKVVTGMPVVEKPDEAFVLKGADGKEIPVTEVKVSANKKEYTLSLGADLSQTPAIAKEYFIGFEGYDYAVEMPKIYSTEEFEAQYTYDGDDLGATWSKAKTTFKVWAPTAEAVKVNLYQSGTKGTEDLIESIEMTKGEKGVWSAEKTGDLNGTYYTYTAVQDGKESEACDPYARTTGVNGDRAMVIDLDSTDPAGWANDSGPNQGMSYNDSVIYELHVRDFSIDESSGISDANKGKFLGLTEKGTTNATGQTTGLDYLTDLGVTHIHLLPIYDYATVDETKLDEPQFNWGYDPKNYNAPEGSYSTDPYNGAVRVKEMKQMVKTLHDNNINVIMDVVYNHVFDADEFCFNKLVPKYFSRTNADGSYSSGSGCGNDTASERAMVKKYIVDSVNYWADEYHIDGFRFDLVGLLDTETINEVVNTVHQKHPDAVFYGEGWSMDTAVSKDGYTMATQANSTKTPNFAFFSDTIRDAIKGGNFDLKTTGFATGASGLEQSIADCFKAATSWCKSPTQTVNYASCHDNYTLWDKISVSRADVSEPERIKMNNLAAAIYMMAEGIPLIHAGEEILRSKPSVDGNGVEHNSYNLPDSVNSIKWNDLNKEAYRNVRDYYKGLIEFRKNHAALRLTSAAAVKANVNYKWIAKDVVMFVIGGKDQIAGEISDGIVVIFNAATSPQTVNLYQSDYGVAEGTWNICINDQKAGVETLDSVTVTAAEGQVQVAPISAMVLVKGEAKDQDSVYDKNELLTRKLQALKKFISTCENMEQGNYTNESWKTFTDALAAAKTTAGKTDVTVEEIDSAMDQLRAAYDGLEVPAGSVDTGKLSALIEKCSEVTEQGNYTDESWTAFQEALKKAKDVLAKTDATQEEIDQALAELQAAYDGLKVPEGSVDTGKLNALVKLCSGLTEQGNYTDESWTAFQEALKKAKAVLEKEDVTQTEIDQALAELQTAYDGLKVPEGSVDTGKLSALVKEYQKLQPDDYTEESWDVFQTALKAAERVLADPNATQEEVNRIESELKKAHAALEKLEDVPHGLWMKWEDASMFTTVDDVDHITYTGKAVKPVVQVYDGRRLLKEKTDYTVAYKQNTNAGEAVVTIKGKGNYTQYLEKRFIIDKVDIDNLAVTDLYGIVAADNKKQVQPKPVVKYNGKALKLKTDYTVAYQNPETDGKTPGTYSVILQSNPDSKNFTGSKTIQMLLGDKADAVLMSKVSVQKIPAQPYAWDTETKHGKVQKPEVIVKHGSNNQLVGKDDSQPEKEWDYEVIYDTVHTEAGETATITVKGNNKKYFGEKTVSFKITGTALKANKVSLKDVPNTGLIYTGTPQEPEVEIIDGVEAEQGYPLYRAVYQKNTDVGTATVTVTGINGYTGTVKKTFKIKAYDIAANEGGLFTFGEDNKITDQIPYAKGGSKLTDENVRARFTKGNGAPVYLEQGIDYTLSYRKNTAAGSAATVSIKGKGNYKGTIKDIPFTIVPQELGKLAGSITAGDILVKNARKYNTVIPVITDLNGKKLKNKTDFTIDKETAYTYADGSEITETPAVDSVIKVTAVAKGSNYTGQVSAEFRVIANDKNIASARIKVEPQYYTGYEIKPGKEDITVEMKESGKWVEIDKSCFEITGYSNNIKKGTAKVTIHGTGVYGGSKTVSFRMKAKPMRLGTR